MLHKPKRFLFILGIKHFIYEHPKKTKCVLMNVKILMLSGFIRTLGIWAGERRGFSDAQIPNAYFKIKQSFTYTARFSFQTMFLR